MLIQITDKLTTGAPYLLKWGIHNPVVFQKKNRKREIAKAAD